jgi:O-antigen ligase
MNLNKKLLLLNLFFLQAYLIRFEIGGYPTNLQEILVGLQFLAFLYAIIKERIFFKTISDIKRHWIILGFLGLTALAITTTKIVNDIDLIRHLKFLLFAAVLTFIFMETFRGKEEKENAIKIAGFGAIVFGIFSSIYNLLGFNVALDYRLLGPLDSAVYLSFYLTPFFLYFTIKFLEDTKRKSNLISSAILALLLIATRSMGSILGSIVILLIYMVKKTKLLKKTSLKIATALILLTVISIAFYTKILPTIKTDYSSLDERGEIWLVSAGLLKEPKTMIFGLGPSQFEQNYINTADKVLKHPPLDYYVIQPHNIFLLFIFNYGILGLIFLLVLIAKTISIIIKPQAETKTSIREIAGFVIAYFFLHGLIDTPFIKNDLLILLFIFLEMAFVITSALKPNPSKQNKDLSI